MRKGYLLLKGSSAKHLSFNLPCPFILETWFLKRLECVRALIIGTKQNLCSPKTVTRL
uniref:Uncharacterized protein n=1 Tax=Arundo donax TaxID=35708 RepID=A0A0A9GSA1_ARUDO